MKKALLRREFLQKRIKLTPNEVVEYSFILARNTLEYLKDKSFQTLHTFLPQHNKTEIDTWKIISALQLFFPHIDIVVPYIIPGTRELEHYLLTESTILVKNQWGIPEPDPLTSKKVLPEILDVVLIPLLAFDKKGYRVGYGGGYYDRFLAQCQPETLKVGLSFFEPVPVIEDIDGFDIKMNACITLNETFYW